MINECWTPQSNHKDTLFPIYLLVKHQSVNLLIDYIILAILGVKNQHFPGGHAPTLTVISTLWLGTLSHFKARSAPASVPCYKTVIAYVPPRAHMEFIVTYDDTTLLGLTSSKLQYIPCDTWRYMYAITRVSFRGRRWVKEGICHLP